MDIVRQEGLQCHTPPPLDCSSLRRTSVRRAESGCWRRTCWRQGATNRSPGPAAESEGGPAELGLAACRRVLLDDHALGPPRPRGVVTSPALDSVDRHLDRPPSGVFGWPLRCTPTHAHRKFILVASNKNTIVLQVICYFKIIVTSTSPKRLHRMKLKWFYSILFTQTYFKI